VIVVDDASTDDTEDVVATYEDDRLNYVRHETNQHLSAARNTGIKIASGTHIAFLDDDDEWINTKLEKQVHQMERTGERVGLVYCWMDYYDGEAVVRECHPTISGDIYEKTLSGQPLGNASTWLVATDVFDNVGCFDEEMRRGIDGDFLRRACREYHVDYIPEVLTVYNVGHDSRRITSEDEESLRLAIEHGQSRKFEKYGSEFEKYPKRKAIVRAKIGWRRTQLGEWRNGIADFDRAVRLAPSCTTVYFYMGVAVYHLIRRTLNRG
jgi:glycosyltransferase involved in cell wall biosynthesis